MIILSFLLVGLGIFGLYLSAFIPRSKDPAKRHMEWIVFWLFLSCEGKAKKHLNEYMKIKLEKAINGQ